MHFASDNAGPAHPAILKAMVDANEGFAMAYGDDDLTGLAIARVREVFEAPMAEVFFVTSGTAANAITLASLAKPWETIFAARTAHIEEDECGAAEFMTGGSKITLVDGTNGKMDPDALDATANNLGGRDVHGVAPGPVSITQATEKGTLYSVNEIRRIASMAKGAGVPLHMDGARFANAVAALDVTPADLTWRAGVDALSLGATKNGCVAAEAIVIFDPSHATEIDRRRMRAGHLASKHRYIAAQMHAWLSDDLWLTLAHQANTAAARLTRGLKQIPDVRFSFEPAANILFVQMPRALHRALRSGGAQYHIWDGRLEAGPDDEMLTARLVCDWSKTDQDIDQFLNLF